jgi:hypothetical protein
VIKGFPEQLLKVGQRAKREGGTVKEKQSRKGELKVQMLSNRKEPPKHREDQCGQSGCATVRAIKDKDKMVWSYCILNKDFCILFWFTMGRHQNGLFSEVS